MALLTLTGHAVLHPIRVLGEIGRNIVGRGSSASHKEARPPSGCDKQGRASGNIPPLQRSTSSGQQAMKKSVFSRSESMPMRREQQPATAPPPLPPAGPSNTTSSRPSLPDIDSQDAGNHLAAPQYAAEIYANYHRVEESYRAPSNYMDNQPEVTPWMRGVLVDWLVEVHLKFKLMPETLYITVNIIDRFLATRTVKRKELQLTGVAAMFLASKYEEIWAPEVRDFVYICDKAYTRKQIVEMEKNIVIALKFKVTFPTSYHFAARYMKAANSTDKEFAHLCQFLIELALPQYEMLSSSSSEVAAAAVMLALKMTDRVGADGSVWPDACEKHSGYGLRRLEPIAAEIQALVSKAAQPDADLKAVYKKFSSAKFSEVARVWEGRPDLFPAPRR